MGPSARSTVSPWHVGAAAHSVPACVCLTASSRTNRPICPARLLLFIFLFPLCVRC